METSPLHCPATHVHAPPDAQMINHMIKFEADLRQEVLSNIHKMKARRRDGVRI